jgi:hypothetical protein
MNDFNDDDIDEELLKDSAEFMNKVGTAAKKIKWGESIQIPCDCGGTLTVSKSNYNGHIHAHCDKCDKSLMQ